MSKPAFAKLSGLSWFTKTRIPIINIPAGMTIKQIKDLVRDGNIARKYNQFDWSNLMIRIFRNGRPSYQRDADEVLENDEIEVYFTKPQHCAEHFSLD